MTTAEKEQKEIIFWKNSPYENPDTFTVNNIVYKLSEGRILLKKIEKYKEFDTSSTILELGGGQGWACCILKSLYPEKQIYTSDISEYAIQSTKYWEKIFTAILDKKIICKSYEIPLPDESVDLIFTFQSAHHFSEHEKTLREIFRVLKKGGRCLYLHEPSCREYLYKLAYKRVNAKKKSVHEDVLVESRIIKNVRTAGFREVTRNFDPTLIDRGPLETIYFYILGKIPFLQKYLPCTADYIFTK